MITLFYCFDGKRVPSHNGVYPCIMKDLEGNYTQQCCEWDVSILTGEANWFSLGSTSEVVYPYAFQLFNPTQASKPSRMNGDSLMECVEKQGYWALDEYF